LVRVGHRFILNQQQLPRRAKLRLLRSQAYAFGLQDDAIGKILAATSFPLPPWLSFLQCRESWLNSPDNLAKSPFLLDGCDMNDSADGY
jgi:hypothetical protein